MKLAKIIMIGFFMLMISVAALVIFLGGHQAPTTGARSVTMTSEKSGEDLSYAQEIRTLTAKLKGFSEQMRGLKEQSEREKQALRQQIRNLQNAQKTKQSSDKQQDLALQLQLLENRNNDLGQKNVDLQTQIADIEQRLKAITAGGAASSVNAEKIEAVVDDPLQGGQDNLDTSYVVSGDETLQSHLDRPDPGRVHHRPYGAEVEAGHEGLLDQVSALTSSEENPFTVPGTQNAKKPQTVFPIYTLPVTTMLTDSTLLTPLVGRVPFGGNVNDPFKFQVVLGADNLAANGHRIPGVAKVIAAGTAIGNREQSCVRAAVHTMTFIFEDGRISTVDEGGNGGGSGVTGLAYLADPWGKACIRGQYINNASDYLKSRSMAAFLEGLASAYSQAQLTYDNDSNGLRSAYVSGNSYSYAASQGIGKTANEIADYVRERAADAFDVVYVPQAQQVQLIIEQQINIDYDKNARKLSYIKADRGILDYD